MSAKQSRQNSALRSALYRLTSTSTKQLPAVIPHVSTTLIDCRQLISSEKQSAKDGPDGVALQKLKTLVNAFLADKTTEKRWSAIVLIKTLVDVGSTPILQASAPWIQGLISVLKRNDPPSSRRLAIITLTKIFLSTHGHPALLRELTTPALPQFITHCLPIIFPKAQPPAGMPSDLVCAVLESFCHLLPNHSSIFRTFTAQLRTGLLPLLAPTPSSPDIDFACSAEVTISARRLFALLSMTAPKNGSSDDWNKIVVEAVTEAHLSADMVFRAVVEDWSSVADHNPSQRTAEMLSDEARQSNKSPLRLPAWNGVHAGCERLCGLLDLLQTLVSSPTAAVVSLPIGRLVDLIVRLTSTTIPSTNQRTNQRHRDEIAREERESLWSHLPEIHTSAFELIESLLERYGQTLLPLCATLIDQINWVFQRESSNVDVREFSYAIMSLLIERFGVGFSRAQSKQLSKMMRRCCEDIVPTESRPGMTSTTSNGLSAGSVLATVDSTSQKTANAPQTPLQDSALALLTAYLSKIPAQHIPLAVRATADRTAILSQDRAAMQASVLNPPSSANTADTSRPRSSILPFLARAHPADTAVEGLVRPRMPIVPVPQGAGPGGLVTESRPPLADESSDDADSDGNLAAGIAADRIDDLLAGRDADSASTFARPAAMADGVTSAAPSAAHAGLKRGRAAADPLSSGTVPGGKRSKTGKASGGSAVTARGTASAGQAPGASAVALPGEAHDGAVGATAATSPPRVLRDGASGPGVTDSRGTVEHEDVAIAPIVDDDDGDSDDDDAPIPSLVLADDSESE